MRPAESSLVTTTILAFATEALTMFAGLWGFNFCPCSLAYANTQQTAVIASSVTRRPLAVPVLALAVRMSTALTAMARLLADQILDRWFPLCLLMPKIRIAISAALGKFVLAQQTTHETFPRVIPAPFFVCHAAPAPAAHNARPSPSGKRRARSRLARRPLLSAPPENRGERAAPSFRACACRG